MAQLVIMDRSGQRVNLIIECTQGARPLTDSTSAPHRPFVVREGPELRGWITMSTFSTVATSISTNHLGHLGVVRATSTGDGLVDLWLSAGCPQDAVKPQAAV